MTSTTEGVFDEFVRARWEDLEPAARVVVLDPDVAREVTAEALARLRSRWTTVVEEGRPADEARRLVLSDALARSTAAVPSADPPAAADHLSAPAADGWAADPLTADASAGADDADDRVVTALVEHLRELEPLDRALLAARQVWGAGPEDVGRWLDRPATGLRHRDERVHHGLEAAHTAAREREGATAAPWALDRDLARAVDAVLGGLTDPPDPAALVEERVRRVRRRGLVLGVVAATATVGGIAAFTAVSSPDGPTTPRSVALPAPTDRVWASTSSWPTRGPLAADPVLPTFVERRGAPGDHVLWAGDLGSRRLVVSWTVPHGEVGEGFGGSTGIRLYTGSRGADLLTLDHLDPAPMVVPAVDCVAVVLADGPDATTARGSLLLVLGRLGMHQASYSPVARPTVSGGLRRAWTDVVLDDGVGASALHQPVPLVPRVRVDGHDVEPVTPPLVIDDLGRLPPREVVERFVSSLTGIPRTNLRTTVTSDDPVERGLIDDTPVVAEAPDARVVALRTTTPDGAVLRSVFHLDAWGSWWPLELGMVVPADAADQPYVIRVGDPRPGTSRYVVLHPEAATVRLLAADGRPASRVIDSEDRSTTVVRIAADDPTAEYRVVLKDRRGRTLFDGVPVRGRSGFDS